MSVGVLDTDLLFYPVFKPGRSGTHRGGTGQLSSGQSTVSSALFEREAPTAGTTFGTVTTMKATNQGWLLNEEKAFVLNGDRAEWFLVLASIKLVGSDDHGISADENASGVIRSELFFSLAKNYEKI